MQAAKLGIADVPILYEGPRRAGCQLAIEFTDPDGHNLEIYWNIEQVGTEIRGTHKGAFLTGDIHGFVDGHLIRFRSSHKYEGSYVNYDFSGAFENGRLHGQGEDMSTIDPGEFGEASWSAERYQYTEPRGVIVRPLKTN